MHGYRAEFDKAVPISHEILELADAQDSQSMRVDAHLMVGVGLAFTDDLEGGLAASRAGHQVLRVAAPRLPSLPARSEPGDRVLHDRRHSSGGCAGSRIARSSARTAPSRWRPSCSIRSRWRTRCTTPASSTCSGRSRSRCASGRSGLLDVADEYELPIWRALGTVLLGAAKTDLGHFDEGLAEIADGVAQYQGLRSPPVFWPLLLYVRARACARAGRPGEGLGFIDQAIELSGGGALPTLFFAMKGELLLALGPTRRRGDWFRRVTTAPLRAGREDAAAARRGRALPGGAAARGREHATGAAARDPCDVHGRLRDARSDRGRGAARGSAA